MRSGLDAIRAECDMPTSFPAEVVAAAEAAADRTPGAERRDRTSERFMTLDPASSVDLDQAFSIERSR